MSLIIKGMTGAMTGSRLADDFRPAMKKLARVSRAQGGRWAGGKSSETMTPADYLAFRSAFGRPAVFQSWQYHCHWNFCSAIASATC